MAGLKYKTRGDSSPQGKPRVYFCCHPEDFERYFKSVSNEILEKQDCAIWYTDEAIVRDEDFFLDLAQMQLFLLPVTSKLLFGDSDTLDVEFRFAIENHICVLPLMQENGLDETFNKKCDNIQFLNKYNNEATALSYDEKLHKYLESVLVGDELAKKIRAAFRAYMFLSYRKEDRKYAQDLMRLVHKNEFCRDIAIWYDEFLTLGEDFNESIKEAIQKSGLFLLTVTPNLINEPNYIMTIEYPLAKQEGKPILPAELVPTDKEKLSKKFENIPNSVDAHNETELSKALLESIKKMTLKKPDNSPEHKFLVGLAYFNGIDVEIDREKAIEIITQAANTNCLSAVKFLANCHKTGNGVPINHQAYVDWEEKLIRVYQEEFRNTNNSDSGYKLVYELLDFSRGLLDWHYLDESISIASIALAEFKRINDTGELYSRLLYTCYECIADAYFGKDPRIADQYYCLLQCILEKKLENTDENGKEGYIRKLCSCLLKRYDIVKKSSNEGVHTIMNKLLEILNSGFLDSSGVEERRNISLILERKGNILIHEKNYNEAINVFQKKRHIDAALYDETKESNDLRNETIALEKLGDIETLRENGSLETARNYYANFLEKSKYLATKSNSIEALRDLAIAYEKMGNLYVFEGQNKEALTCYLDSHKIISQLYESASSGQTMEDYARSFYKIGVFINNKEILDYAYEIFSILAISTNRKSWHKDIMEDIQKRINKLQ